MKNAGVFSVFQVLKSLAFVQSSCTNAWLSTPARHPRRCRGFFGEQAGKIRGTGREVVPHISGSPMNSLKTGFERQNAPGNG